MNDPDVKLLVAIAFGILVVGSLWYFRDDLLPAADEPAAVQVEAPVEEPETPSGPAHPVPVVEPGESAERNLVPLPSLDDSDSYFLMALVDIFGAELESVLVKEGLIDKIVVTVDNLPRKHVAEKIRPAGRLKGDFTVDAAESDDQFYMSADSYARYDALVELISTADLDAVADTYRRFYPLFQESYVGLGYPNAYFNDRAVEVIDHLLLTPTPDQPILLVRPHVLYEYADPELAALSSGQKLLLRMGTEHAEKMKVVLRGLRARIAT
ncbi:MAG: DUF3014 domain-containing protein [Gammaproteobacteria bacterium]|nr:DUF3014 domain-containing protein [Gammaproteobacteria bacterium]